MDTFLSISLTLLTIIISLYVVISRWRKQDRKPGTTLPPGGKGWPYIGESLDFLRQGLNGTPQNFITQRMIKHSPKAFTTRFFGVNLVVFCGASGNKCLYSTDKNSVIPWIPASVKKLLYSPKNARALKSINYNGSRGVVNVFVKPETLQQKFVHVMDVMAREHIEKNWAPHEEVHVLELAKKYYFMLACKIFLSVEDSEKVARLEGVFKGIIGGFLCAPINLPWTAFNHAMKCANGFRKELMAIIERRKIDVSSTEKSDLLSHLLISTNEDGEFRDDIDVADMILGLFVAGYHPTSSIITFIIKFLAEIPSVHAEVLKEQLEISNDKKSGELLNWEDIRKMKLTWNVANEVMRLAPPAQGIFREATDEFSYAGFTIPKGYKVYMPSHSTNKNPEYFKNPEKFDPSRFIGNGPAPYSFAPFGGGPHICPGREYARIAILVFIHNLVTQFELEILIPNEKIIYLTGATPSNGLPIRLRRRNGHTN